MATWFRVEFEGEPTERDFARVAELAAQGFTSGQLINDPAPAYPQREDYDGWAAYAEAVETWEAENGGS